MQTHIYMGARGQCKVRVAANNKRDEAIEERRRKISGLRPRPKPHTEKMRKELLSVALLPPLQVIKRCLLAEVVAGYKAIQECKL